MDPNGPDEPESQEQPRPDHDETTLETNRQHSDPELLASSRSSLLRWVIPGTIGLAGALALILTLVLPLFMQQPTEPTDAIQSEDSRQQATLPQAPLAYEEPLAIDLQEQSIHLDALIMRTLIELGADPQSIEAYAFPAKGNEDFRARSLGFALPVEPVAFQKHLSELLKKELPKALLTPSGPRQFSIIVDGVRTHELFLSAVEQSQAYHPTSPVLPADVVGTLAIVIDDMGEDTRLARGLADTGLQITFAVWPFSSHRDAVRTMAVENDLDLLVHLPMQPQAYPEHHPGPNALYTTMTADEITSAVQTNLDLIPEAIGVNNHMGSAFTSDLYGMKVALRAMKNRGLFFLDSRTTGKTKGLDAAKATGIPFYGRDVFIDNDRNVSAIIGQLTKAEGLARHRGSAIAIGHPHPETLQAIKQWARQARGDVSVVRLSALQPIVP